MSELPVLNRENPPQSPFTKEGGICVPSVQLPGLRGFQSLIQTTENWTPTNLTSAYPAFSAVKKKKLDSHKIDVRISLISKQLLPVF